MSEPILESVQPYYLRRTQNWAIDNVRQQHEQALYSYGEPVLFTLLWKVEDHEAGLVDYCSRCHGATTGSVEQMIESAYQQPLNARCPVCFGTLFEGGIRAQIVQPAIVTDADEDERPSPRGVVRPESITVETTDIFRSRSGDLMFRRDGSRWQLGAPRRTQLRTGYAHPTQTATSVGYGSIPASREDEASVAYDIPPTASQLATILDVTSPFPQVPPYQVLNGPLIPPTEVE